MPARAESAAAVRAFTWLDPHRLEALLPEWDALWTRNPHASVSASPIWLTACWRHFERPPLRVVELRAGERLAGVVPLIESGAPRARVRLELLGAAMGDLTDPVFASPLVETFATAATAATPPMAALALLADLPSDAAVDLRRLDPEAPLARAAARLPGWAVTEDEPSSVLDLTRRERPARTDPSARVPFLTAGRRALQALLPAHHLERLEAAAARAEREGGLRLVTAEEVGVDRVLEALFALQAAPGGTRREGRMAADANTRAFHREVARRFFGRGLRLYGLVHGGRWIAAHYGFRRGRREVYVAGGYDPAHPALVSELGPELAPGALLLARAIQEATRAGVETLGVLRTADTYGCEWVTRDRPSLRIQRAAV